MKETTADLYIRVSTDEQAEKGYSQRSQEDFLRKFCELKGYTIRQVIFEDHSAKTFNRPKWKNYLLDLKRHRGKTDFVLFLKWDRFSRNAGDAYQMISILRRLGVEPQAIEQPLDMEIPESKMMLAFYLAAPEVENDRRSLNVIHGMRRAMKEGRHMNRAPVGYKNVRDENDNKIIIPVEPMASLMIWAFEEVARKVYNTEQIFKLIKKKGFTRSRAQFWLAVRNPAYCGKLFIPKYKKEESVFVKGKHQPLISEALFNEVQEVLDGRGRSYKPKVMANLFLPLRGLIVCPNCGKLVTGSGSVNRYKKAYPYYHCSKGCRFRERAEDVNEQFYRLLKKYSPRQEMMELYQIILQQAWKEQSSEETLNRTQLGKQIKDLEGKISVIRDLLASRKLDPEEFNIMKSNYTQEIEKIEAQLSGPSADKPNIKNLLKLGIGKLLSLDSIYENSDNDKKIEIISSCFPDKLYFENRALRTFRVNEVLNYIYQITNDLGPKNKRENGNNSILSSLVAQPGFEPRQIEPKSIVLPLYY